VASALAKLKPRHESTPTSKSYDHSPSASPHKWEKAPKRSLASESLPDPALPDRTPKPPPPMTRPPLAYEHIAHKAAMDKQFPEGWSPPRRLSREAMDGLRALHAHDPVTFSTPVLASKFKISPEAVARILKSKWKPSNERLAQILEKERIAKDKWLTEQRTKELEERRKQWLEMVDKNQFSLR